MSKLYAFHEGLMTEYECWKDPLGVEVGAYLYDSSPLLKDWLHCIRRPLEAYPVYVTIPPEQVPPEYRAMILLIT